MLDNIKFKIPTQDELRQRAEALWVGEIPLFQTFWFYFFIGVFVLLLCGTILPFLEGLFEFLALFWAGFMIRPVLVAADKYPGDPTWPLAAKIASIFLAMLIFLKFIF